MRFTNVSKASSGQFGAARTAATLHRRRASDAPSKRLRNSRGPPTPSASPRATPMDAASQPKPWEKAALKVSFSSHSRSAGGSSSHEAVAVMAVCGGCFTGEVADVLGEGHGCLCLARWRAAAACSLQGCSRARSRRAMNAQSVSQRRALVCACKRVPNLIVLLREPKFSLLACLLSSVSTTLARRNANALFSTEPSGGFLAEHQCCASKTPWIDRPADFVAARSSKSARD